MTTALAPVAIEPAPAARPLLAAAHTLAAITLVGMVSGAVVVGLLGRLAMALIAALNPLDAGLVSDDGFPIGQVTLAGSANLLAFGVVLGVVGAFGYTSARGLMVGPGWFRLLSISVGPGVVVGALVVDTDGVDFTRLDPAWLSAALFVALPTLFVVVLHLGSERVLAQHGRLPAPLLGLGLLPWLPLGPLAVLLLVGWWAVRALRRGRPEWSRPTRSVLAWTLRGGLAVVFALAVTDLVRDLRVLT
ncbi:hypothetical protein [Nocardioides sp. SYSU DS0663]|uniref:hypothetical protein n=1 Tax=Nocardioides sp. SYSU DS0663 TaxID=3416445 RepID=UPI003F4BAFB8